MKENQIQIKEIIEIFNSCGILNNLILIGSWCTFFYDKVFDNFKTTLITTDIDFYVPNSKRVNGEGSIIEEFKLKNYEILTDLLSNKSKLISPDGFEIEFLAKLNRDYSSTVKIGNTGLYAESLPYVDIFEFNYIEVEFEGYIVKVASPSSYILQKLIINDKRGTKALKDIESIKNLLTYINESKKSKDELKKLFDSLPKKWKAKIENNIKKYNLPIELCRQ